MKMDNGMEIITGKKKEKKDGVPTAAYS